MAEAGVQVTRPVVDTLTSATMKVSQTHMLLSGLVESEVPPEAQALARAYLEILDSAVTDLREVALSLGSRLPE